MPNSFASVASTSSAEKTFPALIESSPFCNSVSSCSLVSVQIENVFSMSSPPLYYYFYYGLQAFAYANTCKRHSWTSFCIHISSSYCFLQKKRVRNPNTISSIDVKSNIYKIRTTADIILLSSPVYRYFLHTS